MIRAVVLAALASTAPLVQAQSTDADCAATYAGFVEAGALQRRLREVRVF